MSNKKQSLHNEGFMTGMATVAGAVIVYRFLKDIIGKYLTTKFRNHPVTEKTIDTLLRLSSKQADPNDTTDLKGTIMAAVQSGEIKTIKDLSDWLDKQLQQTNQEKLFENVGGNSFRIATPQAMGMMGEIAPGTPQTQDKVRLTIARKVETNEWLVKVYVNGKYSEDKTYYTDDKQDAIDTAKAMMGDFQKKGCVIIGKDGQPIAPIGEGRCEDYPCCGHEAGDCPDSEGRFTCVGCGKRLPRDAGSSICPKCQSRMSRDDYEDPTGQDGDY